MATQQMAAPGADRRAHIEGLLAEYPSLSQDQLDELNHWFTREASALDVGMIASNDAIKPGYDKFRAENLDRFTLKDIAYGMLFAVLIAGVVAVIGIWST